MQSTIRERASAAASRNMLAETTLWSKLKILAIKITRCGLSISSRLIVVYNFSLVEKEKEKEKKKRRRIPSSSATSFALNRDFYLYLIRGIVDRWDLTREIIS